MEGLGAVDEAAALLLRHSISGQPGALAWALEGSPEGLAADLWGWEAEVNAKRAVEAVFDGQRGVLQSICAAVKLRLAAPVLAGAGAL